MIPTIEDIIKGLLAGGYAADKATHWIDEHLRFAYAEGRKDEREELDQVCPSCKGSGERTYQHLDEYEQGSCDLCDGHGMISKALIQRLEHARQLAAVARLGHEQAFEQLQRASKILQGFAKHTGPVLQEHRFESPSGAGTLASHNLRLCQIECEKFLESPMADAPASSREPAVARHAFSDCFDRGCNGCEDCIEPDSTEART